jgi:FdhD protein
MSAEEAKGVATEAMLARVARDGGADEVAVELPLEIRLNGEPVAVTMRTPGDDFALAAGFLFGEGIIRRAPEVGLTEDYAGNTVEVTAADASPPPSRRFYTSSSCGVCGKGALEEVAVHAEAIESGLTIDRELLAGLPDRVRQPAFNRTGGLHATGLFTPAGELLRSAEDVGRHNAMDKVIGQALLEGELPLSEQVLCVSGRLAFELVQKAAVAGCPVLVGVGAPTSLAVELAADRGMTLAGFARGGSVNVYTGEERVA